MKSKVDFINENTTRALMKLFIPIMLAMTLTMAYSMVDSLWVGNLLGEAGMGICNVTYYKEQAEGLFPCVYLN